MRAQFVSEFDQKSNTCNQWTTKTTVMIIAVSARLLLAVFAPSGISSCLPGSFSPFLSWASTRVNFPAAFVFPAASTWQLMLMCHVVVCNVRLMYIIAYNRFEAQRAIEAICVCTSFAPLLSCSCIAVFLYVALNITPLVDYALSTERICPPGAPSLFLSLH